MYKGKKKKRSRRKEVNGRYIYIKRKKREKDHATSVLVRI